MAQPTVELLFWDGCPSHPRALADLRAAMAELGLDPDAIVVREVDTDERAEHERFVGSPTIRIDGVDIVDPGDEPAELSCRVYYRRDGRISPVPDPADVRDALHNATTTRSLMSTAVGTEAPTFTLPDTDGTEHSPGGAPATLVVFTCNHCPYALAWHDRLADVARDYTDVKVLAISSNDAERYPRDSFDAMRERVVADGGWPMPYLYDESQQVARAYDAKTTPDCFVIDADGRIAYRGAPDADHQDSSLNAAWLREALDAVLAGEEPARAETEPVGCSIKWKQ